MGRHIHRHRPPYDRRAGRVAGMDHDLTRTCTAEGRTRARAIDHGRIPVVLANEVVADEVLGRRRGWRCRRNSWSSLSRPFGRGTRRRWIAILSPQPGFGGGILGTGRWLRQHLIRPKALVHDLPERPRALGGEGAFVNAGFSFRVETSETKSLSDRVIQG